VCLPTLVVIEAHLLLFLFTFHTETKKVNNVIARGPAIPKQPSVWFFLRVVDRIYRYQCRWVTYLVLFLGLSGSRIKSANSIFRNGGNDGVLCCGQIQTQAVLGWTNWIARRVRNAYFGIVSLYRFSYSLIWEKVMSHSVFWKIAEMVSFPLLQQQVISQQPMVGWEIWLQHPLRWASMNRSNILGFLQSLIWKREKWVFCTENMEKIGLFQATRNILKEEKQWSDAQSE